MTIYERDIEDVIFDTLATDPNSDALQIRKLPLSGIPFRQVNMPGYGVIDLLTFQYLPSQVLPEGRHLCGTLYINVVELKRGELTLDDLGQLANYMSGVRRWVSDIRLDATAIITQGYLIGRSVPRAKDNRRRDQLWSMSPDHEVYTYSFDLTTGFTFDRVTSPPPAAESFRNLDNAFNDAVADLYTMRHATPDDFAYEYSAEIIHELTPDADIAEILWAGGSRSEAEWDVMYNALHDPNNPFPNLPSNGTTT